MIKTALYKVMANAVPMELIEAFYDIRAYHKELGWPKAILDPQEHRDMCMAMVAECVEVLNAAPWKPWKSYATEYDGMNEHDIKQVVQRNIAEELVDVFFFMSSIMEIWEITPEAFEKAFKEKMRVNIARISNGYNTRNEKGETNDPRN